MAEMQQLVYTPGDKQTSNDQLSTMVLMVDVPMYEKYKKDKSSVPMVNVVDSFDVLRYNNGKSGTLVRPSKAELEHVFGTSNEDEIVKIMLENGELHGDPKVYHQHKN